MKVLFKFAALLATGAALTACGASADKAEVSAGSSTPAANISVSTLPSPTAAGPVSTTPTYSPLPPDASGVQAAVEVVRNYYNAVNARDYRTAYELWAGKGEASGKAFGEFREGYLNTESVDLDISGEPGDVEGAAGSQYIKIPVRVKARMKDGKVQNFRGEYTLRRSVVDGAAADQRSWRIYSAEVREID